MGEISQFSLKLEEECEFHRKSVTHISAYQKNRSPKTKVGSYFTDSVNIVSGVPQFETNIKYQNSKKLLLEFRLKLNIKNNIKRKLQKHLNYDYFNTLVLFNQQ